MLLVDHHHAQPGKLDGVFNDRMSAHQDVDCSVQQSVQYLLSLLAFDDACQQCHADGHVVQEVHDGLQVLFGQYLRRRHDASLITIVQGDEHGHQCHQCLARAHIALQETVHLSSTAHVLAYFADDALLCLGQGEGQVLGVEVVEVVAHLGEYISSVFAPLVTGIP